MALLQNAKCDCDSYNEAVNKKETKEVYCAIYFYLLFGSKNMAEILNILIDAWLNGLSLKQL